MRSQRLLRVEIYPVQINPLTGEALYHQQIHINLQFQGDVLGEYRAGARFFRIDVRREYPEL